MSEYLTINSTRKFTQRFFYFAITWVFNADGSASSDAINSIGLSKSLCDELFLQALSKYHNFLSSVLLILFQSPVFHYKQNCNLFIRLKFFINSCHYYLLLRYSLLKTYMLHMYVQAIKYLCKISLTENVT